MEYKYQYNKKICANCGKMGHEFKSCLDPITSYGVINVKVLDDIDIEPIIENKSFLEPFVTDKFAPKAPFLRDEPVVNATNASPKAPFLRNEPPEKSNLEDNRIGELFKSKFSRKKKIKHILTSKKYKHLSCDITNNLNTTDSQLNYQIDNESINYYDMEKQIEKFCYYKDKVLFLMVSRRFSVGFIDFINE